VTEERGGCGESWQTGEGLQSGKGHLSDDNRWGRKVESGLKQFKSGEVVAPLSVLETGTGCGGVRAQ